MTHEKKIEQLDAEVREILAEAEAVDGKRTRPSARTAGATRYLPSSPDARRASRRCVRQ